MYIKRLEIVGFKSFPERVLVPLNPGISAVVGPNGCGKSNIIDAIRWVMGEQSPRMLRGRNMDDVLFNGSQGRPASALAEVTLTLARDADPAAGRPLAAESSVTRRLYRSGDSEYLINRSPCRLKDVVHFFTDHGVGTRAYGIIEQGRVGWLVDARPEERRGLIDEAAGITRYKQQKKEAERKIESAEANLVNVSVIKAETKKQLDQITRAAAKAARYQALKTELRELDLTLSARNLTEARQRRREIIASREENRRLLSSLLAEAERHELEMGSVKLELAQAEKDLEEKTAAWHQLTAARDSLNKEMEYTRSNLSRSEERRVQTLGELARISSERRRQLEEEARLTEALADLEREDGEAKNRAEGLQEQWRSQKSAFESLSREYDQAEAARSAAEREAAAAARQLAGDESLLTHQQGRLQTLSQDEGEAERALAEAENNLSGLSRQKDEGGRDLESARDESAFQAEALTLAEREQSSAAAALAAAESKLAALTAKLETLRSVKERFDWYPQGVKALMADPDLKAAGLLGPLAEFLSVPDGYEEAAEAALGERLAWLVAENRPAALAALKFLDDRSLGRCGFICHDRLAEGGDLTRTLLGDYQLAEDLAETAETAEAVLTKSGRYAGRSIVAGGRSKGPGKKDAGLLARLKEVETLAAEEDIKARELTGLRDRAGETREAALAAREAARVSESARNAAAAALVEIDKAMARAESEAGQARRRHETAVREKAKTEEDVVRLTRSLAEGNQRRQTAESAAETAAAKAAELKDRLDEQREALEDLRAASEEARLGASAAAQNLDRGRHDLARVTQWLSEVEDNLAARETEAEALAQEIERFTEAAQSLGERAAAFPERLGQAEAEVSAGRERQEAERRRQESKEIAAREVRRRREDLNSILTGQETELMAVNFSLDKIEEDLRRDWRVIMPDPLDKPQMEPAPIEPDAEAGVGAEEGVVVHLGDAGQTEQNRPDNTEPAEPGEGEEAPPAFEDLDPAAWAGRELPEGAKARCESLKNKISSLGEVSLGAIEKEAELKAEYQRYQTQFDDLSRAIADLKDSIARINHTCKIRFSETFEAVDAKFREIFPILFEGGEGWLSLTGDGDPLESGVEIHVHPPGKKVLVMSLLSGGEKALTALALIFALYLIKPSPFCLLDETDAPLDEANIDRFNRLLRQLSRASQIIMVTHNKRTMQISRTLYGVTMETPGVSRLVSVNLAEAEAMTADV